MQEQKHLSSDRIIYVWYKRYGLISEQGIFLTREYEIYTKVNKESNETSVHVKIEKNKNYHCPEHFYGNNIKGVTMVVGENGSGKTTLARALMDYPLPALSDTDTAPFFWLVVSEHGEITAYCYNISIISTGNIKIKKERWDTNQFREIYVTNTFNYTELTGNIGLNDMSVSDRLCRQIYSPAALLRYGREKVRKGKYGYRTIQNQYLTEIQYYADIMEQSDVQAYVKKQEELMIQCYKESSDEIKNQLGIFEKFNLKVAVFAGDFWPMQNQTQMDEKGKALSAAKHYYQQLRGRILKDQEKNFWLNLYVLCLAEAYLVLCSSKTKEAEKIKAMLNRASALDENMLLTLKKVTKLAEKTPWAGQIGECLDLLKQYLDHTMQGEMADWSLGMQFFDDSDEMIDWYCDQLKKPSSFFTRNLSFSLAPISCGEQMMINLFAYITDAMYNNPDQKDFFIIIDEIDAGLHPRWQQNILKYLLDWLGTFEDYQFQLVVTTHSPFVLSDILNDHVIKLEKSSWGQMKIEQMETPTFGANIAMQLLDGFFMDEGNIGAFAKEKIGKVICKIKNMQNYQSLNQDELFYLVDSIGEDIVRGKLRNDLRKKKSKYMNITEQWEKCSYEERQQILKFIESLNTKEEQE